MPLGLYLHIPFCRKRCHFCYFRVYTDKNASEVQGYLDVLAREWELYNAAARPIAGRPLNFVYFGGGTPSYLSTRQLESLVSRMDAVSSWREAEEITFECEPGTLTESKLAAIRGIGVTRLSLGVENFDDAILEANGRAHRSAEIGTAYAFAQSLGFPQINIDLIAGMLGETDDNWQRLRPEDDRDGARQHHHLPDGAAVQHDDQQEPAGARRRPAQSGVANWSTKRRWVEEAFEALETAGYHDRIGVHRREESVDEVRLSRPALAGRRHGRPRRRVVRLRQRRAHAEPRLVRGLLRQRSSRARCRSAARCGRPPTNGSSASSSCSSSSGAIRPSYFARKYGSDVLSTFREGLASLDEEGLLTLAPDRVALTRQGLLRVDSLLPRFFKPEHAHVQLYVRLKIED